MRGFGAIALTVAVGCNAVLGVEELPRSQCRACEQDACGVTRADCEADDRCSALLACRQGCHDDVACRFNCAESYPEAAALQVWEQQELCSRRACTDTCFGTIVESKVFPEDCIECFGQRCATPIRLCIEDPQCEAAVACLAARDCGDPECFIRCLQDTLNEQSVALGLFLQCGSSCSDQCSFGENWTCTDAFKWGQTPVLADEIDFEFTVTTMLGEATPDGVTVRACGENLLSDCKEQDSTIIDNGAGRLTLPIDYEGWNGYLRFEGSNEEGVPFATVNQYLGRPLQYPESGQINIFVHTQAGVDEFVAANGVTQALERGIVGASIYDCTRLPAPGIALTTNPLYDDAATVMYLRDLVPDPSATTTGINDSLAIIFNVEPGTYAALGTLDGNTVARSQGLHVRAREITATQLLPRSTD